MTPFLLRSLILSGAATIFFLVLLRILKKRSPNLHRLLWFEVVLLGLCVIPLQFEIPFWSAGVSPAPGFADVSSALGTVGVSPAFESLPRMNETAMFSNPDKTASRLHSFPTADGTSANPGAGETPALPGKTPSLPGTLSLFWVWLAGIAGLVLRRIYQFVRLQYHLRRLESDSPPLWCQLANGIPVKWTWTENLGPALTLSWTGYRLLFPKTLWDELSDSQRTGILTHEISHYRSGDIYLCELVRLLVILQWFNPFAWFAAWKFEEATEWKCDDAAYAKSDIGPKELIHTLMNVHDSTESLGIYLPSFARINVVARVDRLVKTTSDTMEKTTMKKTLIAFFSIALLSVGLVQINLVAKQVEDGGPQTADKQQTPYMPQPVSTEPQEQPEIEARIKLAHSMAEIPDMTLSRLTDILGDLDRDFRKLRVENQEYYQSLEKRINEAIIKVCDKILAINPEIGAASDALYGKYYALFHIAMENGYTDADNAVLQAFVEECQKWDGPDRHGIKSTLRTAKNNAVRMKIWRLEKIEKPTWAQFEPVLDEVAEFLRTEIDSNTYMAASLIFCAEKMQDAKTISREQLLAVYDRVIEALNEEKERNEWIISKLENQRAIHRLVGQKVESIRYVEGVSLTLFDRDLRPETNDPLVPRDTKAEPEIKEPFLIACSTARLGIPELGELFRMGTEFSGKKIRCVLYVSDKNGHNSGMPCLVKNLDFLTNNRFLEDKAFSAVLFSPDYYFNEVNLRPIAEEFSRFEYKPWHKTFLLIGEDKTILEFGTPETIREKLAELYGKPDAAKVAAGNRAAEEFAKLPQPCSANMYRILIAMHRYHDTYGSFPPAYTVDAGGKKLHSWRTLLLPFLDQMALYKNIRLDEPWDSEHNKLIGNTVIPVYQCHKFAFSPDRGPITNYSVVVGPQAIFEENGKTSSFREINDGTVNTIALVERATPIPWMQPDDISFDDAAAGIGVTPNGIGDTHNGGSNIVFADGSVLFVPKTVETQKLRAVLTKSGGESVQLIDD